MVLSDPRPMDKVTCKAASEGLLSHFASFSQALNVALYAKTIGLGEDPANGSCPSVGGTETVRDPWAESRYGVVVVYAGLSV